MRVSRAQILAFTCTFFRGYMLPIVWFHLTNLIHLICWRMYCHKKSALRAESAFLQGVQSKLRNRRSTSLKRCWFWIRFFKFISQKEVTFVTIKTKVKEREPLFCCWTCTILLLMVGKFEGEKSTKLITLLILRLPAKIQKYQIGWPGSSWLVAKSRRDWDFQIMKHRT